ncbi:MAG TPA: hypothetical protein GX528_07115 [Firmicutes bacterium]|nr:hypothetical protein [Bacillota bacterium]
MRRRLLLLFTLVIAVVLFGVFPGRAPQKKDESRQEVQFLRFEPSAPAPAGLTPLWNLQNHIDEISEAALQKDWALASQRLLDLEDAWANLGAKRKKQLAVEQEISRAIDELRFKVLSRSEREVLAAAQKLTRLVSELSPP